MIKKFAVIKNGTVVNIVACEYAEVVAGLQPDHDLILEIQPGQRAYRGQEYRDNKLVPQQPYESWLWEEDGWEWVAPKPYPATGNHYWNEDLKDWQPLPDPSELPE